MTAKSKQTLLQKIQKTTLQEKNTVDLLFNMKQKIDSEKNAGSKTLERMLGEQNRMHAR